MKKSRAWLPSKDLRTSKNFQTAVVRWFGRVARDLPWRRTSDPYKIWVSEIMLQQTGVKTVIPYYERFLQRFPTIEALAGSSEPEVLSFWEGLGYYRRAKNLRAGAQMIVHEMKGKFPENREELLKVPGIGAYSAGAILSIAFRKGEPALDGNLIRVYSRYYGISSFVNESATLKELWEIARYHTPSDTKSVRAFCEGMMELGATVCTPKKATCLLCPVRGGCWAYKNGMVEKLPQKKEARQREKLAELVFIEKKSDKVAFLPKGSDKKYPDFWRLPYLSLSENKIPSSYLAKYKYSVTHRDFAVYVVQDKRPGSKKREWLSSHELKSILLPAIDRKILKDFF